MEIGRTRPVNDLVEYEITDVRKILLLQKPYKYDVLVLTELWLLMSFAMTPLGELMVKPWLMKTANQSMKLTRCGVIVKNLEPYQI